MKVYMIRSFNKAYTSLEIAKAAVVKHAESKGYTVEFNESKLFALSCNYLLNGEDVFGLGTGDYGCLIEEIELVNE